MPYIHQVVVNGAPIRGLFRKKVTEGDAYRFVSAEAGAVQAIHRSDNTVLPDGRPRVTVGSGGGGVTWRDYVLSFPYLIGINQLEVRLMANANATMTRIPNRTTLEAARSSWSGWPSGLLNPTLSSTVFFEEISHDTVRVYNVPSGFDVVHFSYPATSLQGASRERVQVKNQSDNIGLELLGNGNGIVLRSERGKRGLLRMDDEMGLGIDPI